LQGWVIRLQIRRERLEWKVWRFYSVGIEM
jgi:hypothetical protein